ncbi:MAG: glycosyltransferase [Methyloceanibacter sp.]|uniref:glycosyltransferase n=1 Tax=Methyloceanibacter sp. TaxID=1965321 RepID=UPI003D6D3A8D
MGLRFFGAAPRVPAEAEYHFLLGRYIDAATLARASALAARWGVHPHEVLIANGWLDPDDYYRALAGTCDAPFKAALQPGAATPPGGMTPRQCLTNGLIYERTSYVMAADRLRPNALRVMLARLGRPDLALASPATVRESIYHHFAPIFLRSAVDALAARRPDLSARSGTAPWQRLVIAIGAAAFVGGLLIAPIETIRIVSLMLAVLFVPVIGLRLIAAFGLVSGKAENRDQHAPRIPDAALPTYTLLVPLLHEADMLRPLVYALRQLDWPAAKLDIKLILEATDKETVAAARALRFPGNVEIVVVPDGAPRTKPKALNYALPLARGEYVAIYDAEDRPDRDQLRRAFHAFQSGPPNLATVQARLNIYNAQDSWLTRQFTLEYSALFDGLLPALDRLQLPIPLGGTSNHFRGIA